MYYLKKEENLQERTIQTKPMHWDFFPVVNKIYFPVSILALRIKRRSKLVNLLSHPRAWYWNSMLSLSPGQVNLEVTKLNYLLIFLLYFYLRLENSSNRSQENQEDKLWVKLYSQYSQSHSTHSTAWQYLLYLCFDVWVSGKHLFNKTKQISLILLPSVSLDGKWALTP